MLRAFALIGMAGALAGCDILVQKAEERAVAEIGNAAADFTGNLSVNIGQEWLKNGKIDLGGVELMPGATMTGMNVAVGANGPTVNATFNAPTSPAEVKAYFLREFAANQIPVQQAPQAITGMTQEGTGFRINLAPRPGGTAGTIVIDTGGNQR